MKERNQQREEKKIRRKNYECIICQNFDNDLPAFLKDVLSIAQKRLAKERDGKGKKKEGCESLESTV